MGAIYVHEFMTLDGVIEEPSWTFEFGFDPQMGERLGSITARAEGILLGRVTYEMFEPAWSTRTVEDGLPILANPGAVGGASVPVGGEVSLQPVPVPAGTSATINVAAPTNAEVWGPSRCPRRRSCRAPCRHRRTGPQSASCPG